MTRTTWSEDLMAHEEQLFEQGQNYTRDRPATVEAAIKKSAVIARKTWSMSSINRNVKKKAPL